MNGIRLLCLTALLLAGFTGRAGAAVPASFSFPAVKAPHPLALDPSLSDPAWKLGEVPGNGPWMNVTRRAPAGSPTTVYLLYDDRNLYVAFVAEQAGTPPVATQTTNGVGFGTDDFVGVGVDTSGAGSQAYFFETTPRGTRYEAASENARYRPLWESAATVDANGWRAVMIVPLNTMHLRAAGAQSWRINFFRGIASTAEHYSWAWDGLMGDAPGANWPTFNEVRFWPEVKSVAVRATAAARPKPRLELFALSSVGNDRDIFVQPDGTLETQPVRNVGLDLSYPVTPTINFVGTLAPDFSNVEIDQQTIAPQEFERQLQEYRPFFAQGAQYINAPANTYSNDLGPQNEIFYSPGVGAFDRGAKIEGTYGLQSFGAMTFRGYDQETGDTFDDTAFGWKHALQDQGFQYWADGVLANHSVSGRDDTLEGGFKVRNNKSGFVFDVDSAVETGSWVPDGTAHSTSAFTDIHKPNYEINVGYADISPYYNPIDGYTSNSDIRGLQGFVNFVGATHGIKNWDLFAGGDRLFDESGAIHESDFGMYGSAVFADGLSINGAGPTISLLRGYDEPAGPGCSGASLGTTFFGGAPCYRNGQNVPYNLMTIPVGYHDGTPRPIDASASWGNFDGNWTHEYTISTSRPLGSRFTLGLEYDGTYERPIAGGPLDSQWLRRITFGFNTGAESNMTFSLRSINGLGGFSTQPGVNVAAAFHTRIGNGDLYLNYGTPAAPYTLTRFIAKYVFRAGAADGT
jgi:hypothetical protein